MRGRKPKPTAVKKAARNPGRRPLNEDEPSPPPAGRVIDMAGAVDNRAGPQRDAKGRFVKRAKRKARNGMDGRPQVAAQGGAESNKLRSADIIKGARGASKNRGTAALGSNHGQDAHGTAADRGEWAPPDPPSFLSEIGKAEWRRLVATMPKQMVSEWDLSVLAAYCEAYSTWRTAQIEIRKLKNNMIYKAKSGYTAPKAWYTIMRQARNDMVKIAAEFGFTPSSRSRVKVGRKEDEQNEADRFFGFRTG